MTLKCSRASYTVVLWSVTFALFSAEPGRAQSVGFTPSPDSSQPNFGAELDGLATGQALAVTAYDSRPGALYTLYLDFGGFAFNGLWGGQATQVPGVTPAYSIDVNT